MNQNQAKEYYKKLFVNYPDVLSVEEATTLLGFKSQTAIIRRIHELLSRDELAVLDGGKCILQLRGVRPFLSDKYDLTQHPNYKLTSDYDPKNTFDIEKYLNRKEKINPNDEFVVIDADSLPSA